MELALIKKINAAGEEFFGTANDPDQIPISEESALALLALDPHTILYETNEAEDVISWVLSIPTSRETMELFLSGAISERQLLGRACAENKRSALYLCSAFTLPAYRRKGIAERLMMRAIAYFAPSAETPLYAWAYSDEGRAGLEKLKKILGRPIKERK